MIVHRLAIVILIKHIQKETVCLSRKGEKCGEIARSHLSKITEIAGLLGTEFSTDKGQYGGYITRH